MSKHICLRPLTICVIIKCIPMRIWSQKLVVTLSTWVYIIWILKGIESSVSSRHVTVLWAIEQLRNWHFQNDSINTLNAPMTSAFILNTACHGLFQRFSVWRHVVTGCKQLSQASTDKPHFPNYFLLKESNATSGTISKGPERTVLSAVWGHEAI